MLDPKLIRENPEIVKTAIANKSEKGDVDAILELDSKRRSLIGEMEALKARKNKVSKDVAVAKKEGRDASSHIDEMRQVGQQIGQLTESLRDVENQLNQHLLTVPNLPHDDVPVGKDESDNEIIRSEGKPGEFDFKVRPHWEIGEILGALDIPRGVKISGSGFYTLTGIGAKLERALINFMLDTHTIEHGFKELMIPYISGAQAMIGSAQLPKLAEDMYYIEDGDLYLIPTSEVPITNLHAGEILNPDELPKYYVGFSPCFRREAGSYGKDVRGITRVHQFHKVEMVKIVEPESSYEELEKLVACAETILKKLELAYRVNLLCTGDLSFAAAKCYDLEVYAPGMESWLEVSSCSNFESFQARRMNLRYRPEKGAKPMFVHTLNGSGLALPRTVIAILENYQQADGSVIVPDVLKPYMNGLERMEPI
ncbi:MAG: serine--tRNA ligase [candidate division Zixibacteria bacterium]|nr:serine--tRNA ligase [candidate division Zixibacteria bacterium]